jgi:hypothetical protein
MMRDQLAQFEA